jgi:hypothetical protein
MKEDGVKVLKFEPGTVLNDAQALAAKTVLYSTIEFCKLSARHAQKEQYSSESLEMFMKHFSVLRNNIIMISAVVVETLRAVRIWNTCLPLPGKQSPIDGGDEFVIEDPYIRQAYDCLKRQSDLVKMNEKSITIEQAIDAIAAFKTKEELIDLR